MARDVKSPLPALLGACLVEICDEKVGMVVGKGKKEK